MCPPWLYLFKSVSVSTPLVAAERDGLLGGGAVWWSGRGADEELYFPRIHELTEQPGGRRPDAVKVRLWSTAGSLCVKFVSKLTVTPTKETIIGVFFGLVALLWSHRQLYFSHIVAKHSLALRSLYSPETTWTSHARGRVADVCSDHEWVSVFPDNDPI